MANSVPASSRPGDPRRRGSLTVAIVCPQTVLQPLLTVERRYAQCMRSHAMPSWPDATVGAKGRPVFDLSGAGIDPQSTGSSQFQAKEAACRSLTGGAVPNLPIS